MAVINNNVFIVSVEYIKQNSTLPEYLDDKYLAPAILEAQDIDMQDCIGSPLYQSVYDYELLYLSSGTTIPTAYDTLITKYLKPLIKNYAIYRALDNIRAKAMNTSIVIKNDSATSLPVSQEEVNAQKSKYLALASFNRDMVTRYLITQTTTGTNVFPEYTNYTSNSDTIHPDHNAGYGRKGIYLKGYSGNYIGPCDTFGFGTTNQGWNENRGRW